MKTLNEYLNEYNLSHQHKINKAIHFVCVPLILWSITAMLYLFLPLSIFIITIILTLFFYLFLEIKAFLIMLVEFSIIILSFKIFNSNYLIKFAVLIFIIAWVFQFIGHKFEGKKPSFFNDIFFLLIGPLWINYKILSML